jgi:hypothetical protein
VPTGIGYSREEIDKQKEEEKFVEQKVSPPFVGNENYYTNLVVNQKLRINKLEEDVKKISVIEKAERDARRSAESEAFRYKTAFEVLVKQLQNK